MTPTAFASAAVGPLATRRTAGFFVPAQNEEDISGYGKYLASVCAVDGISSIGGHWLTFHHDFRRVVRDCRRRNCRQYGGPAVDAMD